MCEQPPYSMLVREIEKDVLPTTQRYGMGVIPWSPLAGGWLSGRYRLGEEVPGSRRAERIPDRYDMSLPANQRKLEAADALARVAEDAGITLIEMAIAFVIRHPGVTAAIIGPRTLEHLESQLTGAEVTLSDEVLDKIDAIVPPGVNINPADGGWPNPGLEPRRAAADANAAGSGRRIRLAGSGLERPIRTAKQRGAVFAVSGCRKSASADRTAGRTGVCGLDWPGDTLRFGTRHADRGDLPRGELAGARL